MTRRTYRCCAIVAIVCSIGWAIDSRAGEARQVVALDGTWQIAQGGMEQVPDHFDHEVPVPGLADMARPGFEGVGVKDKDPRREAFWYRRTFTINGPVPAVAQLKVHQAAYGTRVFLNGQVIGDHQGSFTPGYFDLRNALKGEGQPNELIIRVGAAHTALPDSVPWGHDFEKVRYVPGIDDSVEMILAGSPYIVRVQAVPDVPGRKVRAVATLKNVGPDTESAVCVTVRELKSHKPVGTCASEKLTWKAGEERTVDLTLALSDCHLWSPEDPFLYELDVTTAGDSLATRFGMRSFRFDAETKKAVLNGRPYYLRGTNICIYRFFEDPARGDKPWREDWVRNVIRAFRSMNWNCARYCIGFPPELWYRIADEEGLMVQDEFPVWGQTGNLDALTGQYIEWMQERWNHPCVVIWDAQNETANTEVTGKALSAVRHLDLSNRPWDNGWAPPQAPTDVYEAHPYRSSSPGFRLSALAHMSPKPGDPGSGAGNAIPNSGDNPIIINEYGWLWINRDGTPTTLSVNARSYAHLVGPNPTPDDYREAYARTLAAKSEFWRSGRKVAGVLHFCGLGYSRPDGQTSDNFIDIEKPTLEPHFFRYVRDAFAPVGIMIDFWNDECKPSDVLKTPVAVINDLDSDWHGTVTLRFTSGGKTICEQSREADVSALGRTVVPFEVAVPEGTGAYQLVAELKGANGEPVRSLRDFRVLTAAERAARRGIAVGCKVTASSELTKDGQFYAAKDAVDDDGATRWSSEFSDPQWLKFDLGKVTTISRVQIDWEAAYGKAYTIQVSTDGENWKTVFETKSGRGGADVIRFAPVEARYVRYAGTQRGTPFGHSIWEFRVFP